MARKTSFALCAAAFAAFALFRPEAHAQGGPLVPLGFCSLSSLGSATALSACTGTWNSGAGGIPTGANYAVICAYAQAINYRDDGNAPTSSTGTGGQGIAAGNCIPYYGTLTNVKLIQLTSGAVAGISFYKVASP